MIKRIIICVLLLLLLLIGFHLPSQVFAAQSCSVSFLNGDNAIQNQPFNFRVFYDHSLPQGWLTYYAIYIKNGSSWRVSYDGANDQSTYYFTDPNYFKDFSTQEYSAVDSTHYISILHRYSRAGVLVSDELCKSSSFSVLDANTPTTTPNPVILNTPTPYIPDLISCASGGQYKTDKPQPFTPQSSPVTFNFFLPAVGGWENWTGKMRINDPGGSNGNPFNPSAFDKVQGLQVNISLEEPRLLSPMHFVPIGGIQRTRPFSLEYKTTDGSGDHWNPVNGFNSCSYEVKDDFENCRLSASFANETTHTGQVTIHGQGLPPRPGGSYWLSLNDYSYTYPVNGAPNGFFDQTLSGTFPGDTWYETKLNVLYTHSILNPIWDPRYLTSCQSVKFKPGEGVITPAPGGSNQPIGIDQAKAEKVCEIILCNKADTPEKIENCKKENLKCVQCLKGEDPFSPPKGPGAWTALGCIPANPAGVVKKTFDILLPIIGGILFIGFIWVGFKLITSAGDPKKLEDAKSLFQALLFGGLFFIFSVFIYGLIGGSILGIPGFSFGP